MVDGGWWTVDKWWAARRRACCSEQKKSPISRTVQPAMLDLSAADSSPNTASNKRHPVGSGAGGRYSETTCLAGKSDGWAAAGRRLGGGGGGGGGGGSGGGGGWQWGQKGRGGG